MEYQTKGRFDLLASMRRTFAACLETAKDKNADYAGEMADDCFANFKACEILNGMTAEKGILVRLMDKFKRIDNLLTQDAHVSDEAITDTIQDGINYLGILKALIESRNSPINGVEALDKRVVELAS